MVFSISRKIQIFIILFTFFQFYPVARRDGKIHHSASSLFLLITIKSGRLAEIRQSVCISKSQRSLCISLSRTYAGLCIYYLLVWSNLNFLHNSQWITLPTQSCLVLYSFGANLRLSFIMWLIVSFLSPHNIYLLFCCVLSFVALIWLALLLLLLFLASFPHHRKLMVFHWSLSDSKSPQVPRSLINILANFNNALILDSLVLQYPILLDSFPST